MMNFDSLLLNALSSIGRDYSLPNRWDEHRWYPRGGSGDMICYFCHRTALSMCHEKFFSLACTLAPEAESILEPMDA